jgi:hypothetical protein
MRKCIDEGTLQAWFDDELDANAATGIATHLRACFDCAAMAQALAAEDVVLSQGLAAELGQAIPTERLRQSVETALSGLRVTSVPTARRSWANGIRDLVPSFQVMAYASIAAAIVIAGIVFAINSRKEGPAFSAGAVKPKEIVVPKPQISPEPPRQVVAGGPPKTPAPVRAKSIRRNRNSEPGPMSLTWPESQYREAFAKLNEAIKAQPPLRPSLRVEYEFNLAMIDNAIITTRQIARKNPSDPLAAQSMLAAYQSKMDLMNQLAQGRVSEQ